MRVHHLNCATMCPRPARLVNGTGGWGPGRMVCHVLLVETADGLLLVDTAVGVDDVKARGGRLGKGFGLFANPTFDLAETAHAQVQRLGYRVDDVRHIAVTHLDLDHASGIVDFPRATIHVFERERVASIARHSFIERQRYLPALWAHGPLWKAHPLRGETWHGFDAVKIADAPEVYLVALRGHTRGHCGVAVRSGDRWLLHCGDAYFSHGEVHAPERECPLGLRLFQWLIEIDRPSRLANQDRLRALVRERKDVSVFSAHCPVELERLAAAAKS